MSDRVRIGGKPYEVHRVQAKKLAPGDLIISGGSAISVRDAYPFENGWGDKLIKVVTWDGTYGTAYRRDQMFKVARPAPLTPQKEGEDA